MIQGVLISTIGQDKSRNTVQVVIDGNSLILKSEQDSNISLVIPGHTIKAYLGGNRDSLLFLESECLEGKIVYVEATRTNLDFLGKMGSLNDTLHKIQKRHFDLKKKSWVWMFFFLGAIVGLIFFRGPIFGGLGTLVPFSWEKKIADGVFNPKLSKEQIALVDRLGILMGELKVEKSNWPYTFTPHISSSAEANAYATIGGHVFVNTGLIGKLTTPEQLLGVLAHEMSHVRKRHVVRSVFQGLGLFTLLQLLVGDLTGLLAVAIDQGGPLLNLQYSRQLEEEADQLGMELLIQNKIDPHGLPQTLKIMAEHYQKLVRQAPGGEVMEQVEKMEILSSHPEMQKRIEGLTQQANRSSTNRTFKQIKFDYLEFRNQVKEAF